MRTLMTMLTAGVLLLAAGAGAGCKAMAWTASTFTPPKRIEAKYRLPAGRKVLVFVDDPSRARADHGVLEKIAAGLEKELMAQKLARSLVPQSALQSALVGLNDDGNVRIGQVAHEVGAELVIYVQVEGLSLSDDESRTWQGKLLLGVKVRDGEGRKLWPDSGMHRVGPIEFRPKKAIDDEVACKDHITSQLALMAADQVAKLFYAHSERELARPEVGARAVP